MAIVIGVLVAVAGKLINELFVRRSVRRNLRIEYLLSAYRRLEHASNRQMTEAHEAALEEAISDVQLLGSPRQVEMATAFARQFAEDQRADTEQRTLDLSGTILLVLALWPSATRDRVQITETPGPAGGPGPALRPWRDRRAAETGPEGGDDRCDDGAERARGKPGEDGADDGADEGAGIDLCGYVDRGQRDRGCHRGTRRRSLGPVLDEHEHGEHQSDGRDHRRDPQANGPPHSGPLSRQLHCVFHGSPFPRRSRLEDRVMIDRLWPRHQLSRPTGHLKP